MEQREQLVVLYSEVWLAAMVIKVPFCEFCCVSPALVATVVAAVRVFFSAFWVARLRPEVWICYLLVGFALLLFAVFFFFWDFFPCMILSLTPCECCSEFSMLY